MRRIGSPVPAIVVLLAIAATLFAAPTILREIGNAQTEVDIKLARQELRQNDILTQINKATQAVAQVARPSVVHIEARRGRVSSSSGSGWVYDTDGHIVTNAHVVRDSRGARVHFSDGTSTTASIIGADDFTDVAVLKLDRSRTLFPANRATGEVIHQGDRVYVFGSPFGFRFSMSEGIISGLGRNAPGVVGSGFSNFIQTDAAVNPGNSGGPLIDVRGNVVGMTVAIATGSDTTGTTESGQSAGISFAIPLRTIENVVEQFIENGSVDRGFLGVTLERNPVAIHNADSGEAVLGVVVGSVNDHSAADAAGIWRGDVVLSIDGQPTTSMEALRSVVTSTRPGVEVMVEVARTTDNGLEFLNLPLVLGTFPAAVLSLNAYGLSFYEDFQDSPPRVYSAGRGSQASDDGFQNGMVIQRAGDRRVMSLDDLYQALEDLGFHRGRPVEVEVRTGNGEDDVLYKTMISPQSVHSPE